MIQIIDIWQGGQFARLRESGTDNIYKKSRALVHIYALGSRPIPSFIDIGAVFKGTMLPQYTALSVCKCVSPKKKIQATSKQGRRLRLGMLTVLTNIRSTKVLHHA